MVRCVLSQLKPSDIYILSCGKGHGLRPSSFTTYLSTLLYLHNATCAALPWCFSYGSLSGHIARVDW